MSQKIKLSQLIETIAQDSNVDPELIRQLINEFSGIIEEGLMRDGKVRIHNFGTFSLHWINSRKGRSPKTGEPIEISARYRVLFRPAKSLKEAVNRKYAHLRPIILEDRAESTSMEEPSKEPESGSKKISDTTAAELETVEETLTIPKEIKLKAEKKAQSKPTTAIPTQEPEMIKQQPEHAEDFQHTPGKEQSGSNNRGLIWVSLLFILLAILVVFVYFQKHKRYIPEKYEKIVSEQKEVQSNKSAVQASQESQPTRHLAGDSLKAKISDYEIGEEYQTSRGDNLWNLASKYYHQPHWWPYIYNANMTLLDNPDSLEIGVNLNIPDLEGTANQPTLHDRRIAALGYFNAYLAYRKYGARNAFYFLRQAISLDSTLVNARSNEIAKNDMDRLKSVKIDSKSKKIYSDIQ